MGNGGSLFRGSFYWQMLGSGQILHHCLKDGLQRVYGDLKGRVGFMMHK